jgi:hypothetical protein
MDMEMVDISEPVEPLLRSPSSSTGDLWFQTAECDYGLCREFALRFGAKLKRSLRGQRVGWEGSGHPRYAILLPDLRPPLIPGQDEWYLFSPSHEHTEHYTVAERERSQMIILAETAEDWMELLRQSLHDDVLDLRYDIVPDYLDPLGEISVTACGYEITVRACGPQGICDCFVLSAVGATPGAAAREACLRHLEMSRHGG